LKLLDDLLAAERECRDLLDLADTRESADAVAICEEARNMRGSANSPEFHRLASELD